MQIKNTNLLKNAPYAPESLVFLFILLFVAIPANLYASNDALKAGTGSIITLLKNAMNVGIFFYFLIYSFENKKQYFSVYNHPFTYLHLLFFIFNLYQANDFLTTGKNMMVMVMNMVIFSQLFLYPKSKEDFVDMLGIFACVILFLSYFGGIFVPSGAVHLESDGYDAGLAGAWRGIFSQKNAAGGFFAFCTFIGILCISYGRKPMGIAIFFFSVLFIFLAKSKTALGFVFIVNIIGYVIVYTRLTFLSLLGLFVFIAGINLFTVGTIFFPPIVEFLAKQGLDVTFTGRTPLWEFCLQGVEAKPWFGHGSQGFWNQEHIKLGGTAAEEWIHQMGSAHNSLLENTLNVGYIGTFFIICFAFFMPAMDIYKIQKKEMLKSPKEKAILYFLVQTWIFFWCAGTTESSFYVYYGIGWNIFTFTIFALRYLSNFSFKEA